MLGQDVGFPVPEGGAGELAQALRRRAESRGGGCCTGTRVTARHDRAAAGPAGCACADGTDRPRPPRRCSPTSRARALPGPGRPTSRCPRGCARDLDRFQWDNPTIKVNWALDRPVPWRPTARAGAGTVHLGVDTDGFVDFAADLSVGRTPQRPFLLFGQMTTSDPTRSPAGTESAWAYTHVPHGADWTRRRGSPTHVERIEDAVERVAPGFRDSQVARARAVAGRPRGARTPTSSAAPSTPARPGCTSSWSSARRPGLGRPRRRCRGSTSRAPRRTPAAACTAPAAGTPPAPPSGANGRLTGGVRRALARTAWDRLLRD